LFPFSGPLALAAVACRLAGSDVAITANATQVFADGLRELVLGRVHLVCHGCLLREHYHARVCAGARASVGWLSCAA